MSYLIGEDIHGRRDNHESCVSAVDHEELEAELEDTREALAESVKRSGRHHKLLNEMEVHARALRRQVRELGGTPIEPGQNQ